VDIVTDMLFSLACCGIAYLALREMWLEESRAARLRRARLVALTSEKDVRTGFLSAARHIVSRRNGATS
jgi:hypothetical protein